MLKRLFISMIAVLLCWSTLGIASGAQAQASEDYGWGNPIADGPLRGEWEVHSETELSIDGRNAGWDAKPQIFNQAAALDTYTVEADLRFIQAGSTDPWPKYGMYAAYQDDDNWLMVYVDVRGTNEGSPRLNLHGKVNGNYPEPAWQNMAIDLPFQLSEWNQLKVEKSGSSFAFYINGKYVGERNYEIGPSQYGLLALDTQAEYRNVRRIDNIYNIQLDRTNLLMEIGGTDTLVPTVQVLPSGDAPDVTWSSSRPDIVSVNENGLLEAHLAGTATITAEAGPYARTTATITVIDPLFDPEQWGNSASGTSADDSWVLDQGPVIQGTGLGALPGGGEDWKHIFRGDPRLERYTVSADVQWVETGVGTQFPKYGIYAAYADQNNYVVAFLDRTYGLATHAVVGGVSQGWENKALPGVDYSEYNRLTVKKNGLTYTFYVNGIERTTREFAVASGQIGLVTVDTMANYRNVTVMEHDSMYGWGTSIHGNEGAPDSFVIQSDASARSGLGNWKRIFRGNVERQDYTVETDVQLVEQGAFPFAKYGIIASYYDENNFVVAFLDLYNGGKKFVSWGTINGQGLSWDEVQLAGDFDHADYHQIKAVKNGHAFQFYVDGELVQTRDFAIDSGQAGIITEDVRAGYRGFRIYAKQPVQFDQGHYKVTKEESLTLDGISQLPEGANQELSWSSSDNTIATVSPSGTVTGIQEGIVEITVKTDHYPNQYDEAVILLTVVAPEGPHFNNPIRPVGADPWIIYHEGYYYYCYANGVKDIYVGKSADLLDIGMAEHVKVWTANSNSWNNNRLWAPELHFIDGEFYIYYTAGESADNNNSMRMGVLKAATGDPQGAYEEMGRLVPTTDRWAIDPTPLAFEGRQYVVWSGWEGMTDGQQNLYMAEMSDPWTIAGDRVLIAEPEFDWEARGMALLEGPQILYKDHLIHLIYSASGSWTNHYALGILTFDTTAGSDIMDPASWKRTGPVFARYEDAYGVGHASFTTSPDGTEDWIVYHAQQHRLSGWDRNVRAQRFTWDDEGMPNFGYPVPLSVPLKRPSTDGIQMPDLKGWGQSASLQPQIGDWRIYDGRSVEGKELGAEWKQTFKGNANFESYVVSADMTWLESGSTSYPKYGIYAAYHNNDNFVSAWFDKKHGAFATFARVNGQDMEWMNTPLPDIQFEEKQRLTVQKDGNTFYFYVNGKLLQTRSFQIRNGQLGVVTEDTRALYENVTIENVYREEPSYHWGNSVNSKATKNGFVIHSESRIDAVYNWDEIHQKLFYSRLQTGDYHIEAEIRLIEPGQHAAYPKYGLYGDYLDDRNFVAAFLDPNYGFSSVVVENGQWNWQSVDITAQVDYNSFNKLRIEKQGQSYMMYVNDERIATRTSVLANGQTGLMTEGAKASYRNLNVTVPAGEEPEDPEENEPQPPSTGTDGVPAKPVYQTVREGNVLKVSIDNPSDILEASRQLDNQWESDGPMKPVIQLVADRLPKEKGILLPAGVLKQLSDREQSLQVTDGHTSILLSPALLLELSEADLRVKVDGIDAVEETTDLTLPDGMNPVGAGIEFKLESSDGKRVSHQHRIIVQLALTDDMDRELAGIYYVNEETGTLEFIGGTVQGNQLVASTSHNSKYIAAEFTMKFADTSAGAWYEQYVQSMVAKHVMNGYPDGTFGGAKKLTRAEMAVIIGRALGIQPPSHSDGSFSDVEAGAYYAGYVQTLKERGILHGDSSGKFRPDDTITREEMFLIIGRAIGDQSSGGLDDLTAFSDHQAVSSWAAAATARLVELNIVTGEDGSLKPKASLTRYEAAAILYRSMTLLQLNDR